MGHRNQKDAIDETERLPALLAVLNAVQRGGVQGIAEDLSCFFKGHTVLALVGEVLSLIPLKPYSRHEVIIMAKV